jgi:branched-chain amino acid transport system ATP-binding protein
MKDTPILKVQNLYHQFRKFKVLSDVSLEISKGHLTALIGPNGAGKTTFYNIVSGKFAPTKGKIFFDGNEITGMPTYKIAPLGLLRSFQITNIFPNLTVIENVLVPLTLHNKKGFSFWHSLRNEKTLYGKAEEILHKVGLLSGAYRPAYELAYGDKRLIEIAIVLARDPKLVLLDEPTAGMNPEETNRMVQLIKELSDTLGTTFFLTEHDMKVVFSVASYIFVLHQGKLLAQAEPEEIRNNIQVKKAYLGGSLDT